MQQRAHDVGAMVKKGERTRAGGWQASLRDEKEKNNEKLEVGTGNVTHRLSQESWRKRAG